MAGIADRAAVDRDRAGLDQRFEPAARKFTKLRGERTVEPFASLLFCGDNRLRIHGERHAQSAR
jgi:hypothetical protein